MSSVRTIAQFLDDFAPAELAEQWDNVGLLVGDAGAEVERVMTCLTITPASAHEAIESGAQLIVAHHPLPFRPFKRITRDTITGRMLLDLIAARVAVYSPHTAFDSAAAGINQQLAEGLKLLDVRPLTPAANTVVPPHLGTGRCGRLARPLTLDQLAAELKQFLKIESLQVVGDSSQEVELVAVACGSAGELVDSAIELGCECFVTGEARFHTALEAEAQGIGLLLAGHYATERFAVETLATLLGRQFADVEVWASRSEADPLRWL
ncbi:MAG: Nif3-like dinuclear metal center hexameric protein [Pirellulales bacterium]|nr:Nif3-like dinuclear metal center hexameric protein [Pirellulales bacterium]